MKSFLIGPDYKPGFMIKEGGKNEFKNSSEAGFIYRIIQIRNLRRIIYAQVMQTKGVGRGVRTTDINVPRLFSQIIYPRPLFHASL